MKMMKKIGKTEDKNRMFYFFYTAHGFRQPARDESEQLHHVIGTEA